MLKNISYGEVLENLTDGLKQKVLALLPIVENLDKKHLAGMMLDYHLAIAPNLTRWMVNAWVSCKHRVSRKAFADNLSREISEDRPAMLDRLVQPLTIQYDCVRLGIGVRTSMHLDDMSEQPVDSTLMILGLKNASFVCIPWMKKVAHKLGLDDLEYLEKHGADTSRVKQFSQAVVAEAKSRSVTPLELLQRSTLQKVGDLFCEIFQKE